MTSINVDNVYEFGGYELHVNEISVLFANGLRDNSESVTLTIVGSFAKTETFFTKIGLKPSVRHFKLDVDYKVHIDEDEIVDQEFAGIYNCFTSDGDSDWKHDEDFAELINQRSSSSFELLTDSFSEARDIIPSEINRLRNKFGF